VYVPELIFGHLLTSSNYDDSQKKAGPGGLCSPRHRLQFKSRNEGLNYG